MEFQFLGTAAATSIPLVFCNCELCRRARIYKGKNFRKRTSALINQELLLDLGPDLCSQAELYEVDLSKVKYLVQTHSHSDHFDAGHFITRSSEYGTRNLEHLTIVCSKGTCLDMNHLIKANNPAFEMKDTQWQKDMKYELQLVKNKDKIVLGDYEIVAIKSMHDERVEALVYVIGYQGSYVFYGTDLGKLSDDAWNILEQYQLNLVVLDQTYGSGNHSEDHLGQEQVIASVKKMREKKIISEDTLVYATHISHEGNDLHEKMELLASQYYYHIAYDGLKLQF